MDFDKLAYLVHPNGGYVKIVDGVESLSGTPYPITGFPGVEVKKDFKEVDYIQPYALTENLAMFFNGITGTFSDVKGIRYYLLYNGLSFQLDPYLGGKGAINTKEMSVFVIKPTRVNRAADPRLFFGLPIPEVFKS